MVLIRPMAAEDVTAVGRIESQFSSSWTKSQISTEIDRKAGVSLIAENGEEIIGWCCGMILAPEAELLKVAVTANRQRQGVANLLLQELVTLFTQNGVEQIFLEVRSANIPALALYRSLAWKEQGIRKNYYSRPTDDAVLLLRNMKN